MIPNRVAYRVGNRNARNLYRLHPDGGEEHIGVMFTETDGHLVAACLNALAAQEGPDGECPCGG